MRKARHGHYAEVTEYFYIGHEHAIDNELAAKAIKLTTRDACVRVARYAFDFVLARKRKRVTCLCKTNVPNLTDELFLRFFYKGTRSYPNLIADDRMIDATCYSTVKDPERFDVVATPKWYGDVFSDLSAGLAGSLVLAPGANVGHGASSLAVSYGAAPEFAGRNVANPISLVLPAALLLRYIQ